MTENNRKSVVRGSDIVIAYALGGMEKVQDLHRDRGLSVAALASAQEILQDQGEEASASVLAGLSADLFPDSHGVRGRTPPSVGSARAYKVQIDGNGETFLKVPVRTMGAARGEALTVTFQEGKITLSR